MLHLTDSATTFIQDAKELQGIPDDAVLRIAPHVAEDGQDPQAGLRLSFVTEALPGDKVVDGQEVTVCVAPEVAEALEGTTLDVEARPDGRHLVLRVA